MENGTYIDRKDLKLWLLESADTRNVLYENTQNFYNDWMFLAAVRFGGPYTKWTKSP